MQLFGIKSKPAEVVKHIIGRVAAVFGSGMWNWPAIYGVRKTVDETMPDHGFWDRFRHGKAKGYEITGLFGQGLIENITSWVIGKSFRMELAEIDDKRMQNKVEYTNQCLNQFCIANQQLLIDVHEDYLGLGEQFLVVNADGTLSVPSPDTVEIVYDDLDYRKVVSMKIHTRTDKAHIIDEYTDTVRTVTIMRNGSNKPTVITYPVLIGRLPVIHFANDRKTNETRGRPIYESLLELFTRYEDTLDKGLQGAQVAGNPVPVLENLENPDQVVTVNKTIDDETYTDADGNEETRKLLKFDRDTVLLLGTGGRFKFASPPPGFSRDITNVLKLLFLILIDRIHVPEFLWGGAISGGKASVETQMPPWVRFVESRRAKFAGVPANEKLGTKPQGGLHELADVWLRTQALTDNRILVAPTMLRWADLTEGDERLTFEWVKYLHSRRMITAATALRASGLVDNIDSELERALQEAAFEPEQFDDFAGDLDEPITEDGSPDLRKGSGASAPRMPAYSGGKPRKA